MTAVIPRSGQARAYGAPPLLRITASPSLAVIWTGCGAVLLLWWHDTNHVSGLDGWLTNAGRITGLLAGYLIAVLLALMARVPALERGVGTDRLARWHAMVGRYTISLAAAHTVLILWGYAVTAHTNPITETPTLLLTYPDVLMATVALGLLITVGVVSARAARRRLSYETWHFVHLYTYLAVALTFSHQFANGADFVGNAPARWLWSAMYIAVATTLFWFRFLRPIAQMSRHQLRVVDVRRESHHATSVWMSGHHLDRLAVEPGQFFRWRFITRGLWWAANPYSLSAAPTADLLRITVKHAGEHSRSLAGLQIGTRVLAEGPFGAFTGATRRRRKVLLMAGGVGITPIRALFESLPAQPGELTLIYRVSDRAEVLFAEELTAIARDRGATLLYAYGPRGRGQRPGPLDAERLATMLPDIAAHEVYLCGPPGMTDLARAQLRRAGVGNRHIHLESFTF